MEGDARADLAATPGPAGTAVAITWLGEVLVALSRSVTAYQAGQVRLRLRAAVTRIAQAARLKQYDVHVVNAVRISAFFLQH